MSKHYQIAYALEDGYGYKEGDMLAHYWRNTNVELRDNVPFKAEMKIVDFFGGRSPRFYLQNEHGNRFPMFPTEARIILLENRINEQGKIVGEWKGIKRGASYGVKLITRYFKYICTLKGDGKRYCWTYFENADKDIYTGYFRDYTQQFKDVLAKLKASDHTKGLLELADLESVEIKLVDSQK